MKFNDIKPAELENDEILVRLFGELEMENKWGSLDEKTARPHALTWPTLKYLLVNSNRDVDREELLALEYPGKNVTTQDGAMRTRLRRVRDILKPLQLEHIHGLILFGEGKYRINPEYTLLTDEDAFNLPMRRLKKTSAGSEHMGLQE